MVNYQKIKIYKIYSELPGIDKIFVFNSVDSRNVKTKIRSETTDSNNSKYNSIMNRYIREHDGLDNFNVEKIKDFPCKTKQQAEHESYRIRLLLGADLSCRKTECDRKSRPEGYCARHYPIYKANYCESTDCGFKSLSGSKFCIRHTKASHKCVKEGCKNKTIRYNSACDIHKIKYYCQECDKMMSIYSRPKHELSKKHLKNCL
jgi:hypothetical protein